VAEAGAVSIDLGIAVDDAGGLASRLDAALAAGAHMLLTSGGVSMGKRFLLTRM
jgi:molybdopterin biosynthesis enzyme